MSYLLKDTAFVFFFFLFLTLCPGDSPAVEPLVTTDPVKVSIRSVQPAIILDGEEAGGFGIDLWKAAADMIGLNYTFVINGNVSAALDSVRQEKADIAIGAISISKEREEVLDFSYPYFHTGLGIMVPAKSSFSLSTLLRSFFSPSHLRYFFYFTLFLVLTGHVIWLAERRSGNSFHKKYLPGIFEGVYWSIVTASTVGYGDYTPKSKTGRLLSIAIIIISLPLFGLLVGNISSDITMYKMQNTISGPEDLVSRRVGVLRGSTAEDYIQATNMRAAYSYTTINEAIQSLEAGGIDAVVHDRPILLYYQKNKAQDRVQVLDAVFDKQHYAWAMTQNSFLQESVNQALLTLEENGTIAQIYQHWFGGTP